MKLSLRLQHIANLIPKCRCIADIGTDHGYIPIYSINNGISKRAIASDINIGPVLVTKKNIEKYKIGDKIQTRIGSGLSVLKCDEADVIIIAGMGGYLIRDIIKDDIVIADSADFLILQPVQYPEVLRRFLENNSFKVIDEDIVKEDNKYYHIIKVKPGESDKYEREVYYYTGIVNYKVKHPLLKDYAAYKLKSLEKIIKKLDPVKHNERYIYVKKLIDEFKDVLSCQ